MYRDSSILFDFDFLKDRPLRVCHLMAQITLLFSCKWRLKSSSDNLCKCLAPDHDRCSVGPDLGSKTLDTLIVFLKEFFE